MSRPIELNEVQTLGELISYLSKLELNDNKAYNQLKSRKHIQNNKITLASLINKITGKNKPFPEEKDNNFYKTGYDKKIITIQISDIVATIDNILNPKEEPKRDAKGNVIVDASTRKKPVTSSKKMIGEGTPIDSQEQKNKKPSEVAANIKNEFKEINLYSDEEKIEKALLMKLFNEFFTQKFPFKSTDDRQKDYTEFLKKLSDKDKQDIKTYSKDPENIKSRAEVLDIINHFLNHIEEPKQETKKETIDISINTVIEKMKANENLRKAFVNLYGEKDSDYKTDEEAEIGHAKLEKVFYKAFNKAFNSNYSDKLIDNYLHNSDDVERALWTYFESLEEIRDIPETLEEEIKEEIKEDKPNEKPLTEEDLKGIERQINNMFSSEKVFEIANEIYNNYDLEKNEDILEVIKPTVQKVIKEELSEDEYKAFEKTEAYKRGAKDAENRIRDILLQYLPESHKKLEGMLDNLTQAMPEAMNALTESNKEALEKLINEYKKKEDEILQLESATETDNDFLRVYQKYISSDLRQYIKRLYGLAFAPNEQFDLNKVIKTIYNYMGRPAKGLADAQKIATKIYLDLVSFNSQMNTLINKPEQANIKPKLATIEKQDEFMNYNPRLFNQLHRTQSSFNQMKSMKNYKPDYNNYSPYQNINQLRYTRVRDF